MATHVALPDAPPSPGRWRSVWLQLSVSAGNLRGQRIKGAHQSAAYYMSINFWYFTEPPESAAAQTRYACLPAAATLQREHLLLPKVAETMHLYDVMDLACTGMGIQSLTDNSRNSRSENNLPTWSAHPPILTGSFGLLKLFSIGARRNGRIALDEQVALMTLPQLARHAGKNGLQSGQSIKLQLDVPVKVDVPLGWPLSRSRVERELQAETASSEARTVELKEELESEETTCVLTARPAVMCDAMHLVAPHVGKAAYTMAQEALSSRLTSFVARGDVPEATKDLIDGDMYDVDVKQFCLGDVRVGHFIDDGVSAGGYDIHASLNGQLMDKTFHFAFHQNVWTYSARVNAVHFAHADYGPLNTNAKHYGRADLASEEPEQGSVYEAPALQNDRQKLSSIRLSTIISLLDYFGNTEFKETISKAVVSTPTEPAVKDQPDKKKRKTAQASSSQVPVDSSAKATADEKSSSSSTSDEIAQLHRLPMTPVVLSLILKASRKCEAEEVRTRTAERMQTRSSKRELLYWLAFCAGEEGSQT